MDTVQMWLVVGIPALVLALAMLVRGTRTSILIAHLSLAAGFGALVSIDRVSGLVFGALLILLYAAGPTSGSPTETDERQPPLVEEADEPDQKPVPTA